MAETTRFIQALFFGFLFVVKECKYFVSVNVTIAVLIKNHYRFFPHLQKQAILLLLFLCELQKQRQVPVNARVCAHVEGCVHNKRKTRQTQGIERGGGLKIHTPKDIKISSIFTIA